MVPRKTNSFKSKKTIAFIFLDDEIRIIKGESFSWIQNLRNHGSSSLII